MNNGVGFDVLSTITKIVKKIKHYIFTLVDLLTQITEWHYTINFEKHNKHTFLKINKL